MKVAFYTLGCKVNYYETEVLKSVFETMGFEVVTDDEIADAYIVNSCTVTAAGDKKSKQVLRRFARQNPHAVIALTGCMPQAFPEIVDTLPDVQVIVGAQHKKKLPEYVLKAMQTGNRIVDITPHKQGDAFEEMKVPEYSDRTRAFVKIQDGCDRYCSYCIIPKARGFVRSKPLADLEKELQGLAEKGYREVVLVGINLSSYGKECDLRLIDAIELACQIDGLDRVRLGSLEPELLLDEDMARMAKLSKFCPQFHLSLQSGCDETLERMNRHYDTAFYRDLVRKLRTHFDNCSITTDIMVGFAGETEEEFSQSLQFAKEIGFAKVHVFAYSIRPGTRAATFADQVATKQKQARSKAMILATEETRTAFLQTQVGEIVEVLLETAQGEDAVGYTENYTPVLVQGAKKFTNTIQKVQLVSAEEETCIGIVL